MIAVDTSALLAIVFNEPERETFLEIIEAADRLLISSVTVVEARMVAWGRRGGAILPHLDALLALPHFAIVPPDARDIAAAHTAFITFGKGSGQSARLNFGDLFSYSLAKTHSVPLLFKGEDFVQTDIEQAFAA